MKNIRQVCTAVFTLILTSPCLLAATQKIIPGLYGGVNIPGTVTQNAGAQKPALIHQATDSFGGWSIETSAPYKNQNGKLMKLMSIKVPSAKVAGQYEIPASENTGLTINGKATFIGSSFFSDAPDTLVFLSGDRCIQEIYSGSSSLKKEDITASKRCKSIRSEMIRLRGKAGSTGVSTSSIGGTNNINLNGNIPNEITNNSNGINNNNNGDQHTQVTQTTQPSQNNQASLNKRSAQQLSQVADTLTGVVNKLADQLSVGGQPNPLLKDMGETISKISAYLKKNLMS